MNSEELELSLRTEFESYLKGFLDDLRQEVSDFQRNFETEFEKHKSQTDEAVRKLVQRFDKGVEFNDAFNESVVEHLRLARDEGATITAVAIGEAEKLRQMDAPAAEFDLLRDAVNEISSKSTQSEILRALVDHAGKFTPRGAFFIVKNDHFVGWQAFGDESAVDEAAVQAVRFPVAADTVLADSVNTLSTAASSANEHKDDGQFLDALGFGIPDRMYAIPLIARGRGVAVLYADYGRGGVNVNPDALETLVRVAGLTVELAAAGVQPSPPPQKAEVPPAEAVPMQFTEAPAAETTRLPDVPPVEAWEYQAPEGQDFAFVDEPGKVAEVTVEEPAHFETEAQPAAPAEPMAEEPETIEPMSVSPVQEAIVEEEEPGEAPAEKVTFEDTFVQYTEEVTYFEPIEESTEPAYSAEEPAFSYQDQASTLTDYPEVIEEAAAEPVRHAEMEPEAASSSMNGTPAPQVAEPLAEVASAQAARTRFRDRSIDLPIEVPEEERRLHNDARRFARLLVSEIKLYNEQKVSDGREAGDLYDRLREAIDRSREMYDKRVQPPVAEKFDYFHYELVSSLAEGDDVKLGASYPGSKVHA